MKAISRQTFFQTLRYGLVTVVSYIVLFVGTFVLVEFLHINPTLSYALTLTLVYIGVYFASSRFVFRIGNNAPQAARFTIVVIFLWTLNNSVFFVFEHIMHIQYLLAIILNILIFGPLRFIIYRSVVFREKKETSSQEHPL